MRYENWDILLFPEGSKIPIQEFKTQCFVTKDTDSPYLQNPSIASPSSYYPVQGNFGQMPVLTTFVPSLQKGSPFRVSIHSWEKPRPSRLIEGMMQPDDLLLYEARIFVDGDCVAGGVFSQRTQWPYVIDLSSHIDRDGNQDSLRFPAFHREILEQRHWDAGDINGRIRIIIAEGFARPHRSPPFERVKDVVTFSFQHAPLHILEYSNIAWPNPGMWCHTPRIGFKYNTASDIKEADEAHGHSPSKAEARVMTNPSIQPQISGGPVPVYNVWAANRAFPVLPWETHPESRWAGYRYPDSFMTQPVDSLATEVAWRHRGARSSREDIPMPDYSSSSSSSRAISNTTGVSYEQVNGDDEHYTMLIQALTPTKPPGVRAPSNTPTGVVNGVKLGASPSGVVKGKKDVTKDVEETPKKPLSKETVKEVVKEIVKENSKEVSQEDDATSISTL